MLALVYNADYAFVYDLLANRISKARHVTLLPHTLKALGDFGVPFWMDTHFIDDPKP